MSKSAQHGTVMDNINKTVHRDVDFAGYIEKLNPGDHAIALYSTEEQRDILAYHFISNMIRNNSIVMYVTSERSPDYIRKQLGKRGIDVAENERKGLLFIQDGYYTIPPNAAIDYSEEAKKMIVAFARTVYSSKQVSLGGIVETEGLFRYNLVEALLSTESFFGKKLDLNQKIQPIIGLCLYKYDNLLSIKGERQAGLIDSHSHAFFATPQSEPLKAEVDSFVTGISQIVHQSLPSRWIVIPEGWNHTLVRIDGKQIIILANESSTDQRFIQIPGYLSGEEKRVGEKMNRLAFKVETIPQDLRYRVEPRIREMLPGDLRYLHMIFW